MVENDDYKDVIQKDFDRLDKTSIKAEDIKKKLIDKLEVIANELSIDPNHDKPKQLEAKMGVINSYVSLLDSYEKQIRDTLKVKQKQQEMKSSDDSGILIAKILSTVSDKLDMTKMVKDTLNGNELDKIVQEEKLQITEGELDMNPKIESLEEVLNES